MTLLFAALAALSLGALGAVAFAYWPRLSSACGAVGAVTGCSLGAWYAGSAFARGVVATWNAPWSIPNGELGLGVDPLSAFFLVPLFVLGGITAIHGRAYLSAYAATRSLALAWAAFNVFLLGMALVVTARHALLFLVAWESMSISAYLLVTFEHEQAQVRRAGWVYLVATHLGVAFLIAMFLLLGRHAGSFAFAAIHDSWSAGPVLTGPLFLMAVIGFGAKAGLVPLHVWLPEAHAAAPSHVSALMSGVLIKMGIYGILRVVVLLGGPAGWWGPLLMCMGVGGGALGIALAVYQRDFKRALAYSSIENIGLIALGIGVGLWGASSGHPMIATLGLVGALLHIWNHSVMKGLMFLGAGGVAHAAHTRDIELLGGLGRRMPETAIALVIGAVAMAGLPPLNGFVSEWLLYSTLLRAAVDSDGAGSVAMLAAFAALSMIGAMAALCFARLVGVVLLGEPRSSGARHARETTRWMTAPMAALALAAIVLGVAPGVTVAPLERVVTQLVGARSSRVAVSALGLEKLGALDAMLALALGLGVIIAAAVQRARSVVVAETWGCGYAAPNTRMQYTGRAFSGLFTATLLPRRLAPRLAVRAPAGLFPGASRFESDVKDPLTRGAYEPFFAGWADRFARLRWMQQGLLHLYIVYILIALLVGLAWSAVQVIWARS